MKLSPKQIKNLAEESSMMEFEPDIFEASIEDLQKFAELVIEQYEYTSDSFENGFTAYGKKGDWESYL